MVELFVASDLVPEGMWSDRDIEEVEDDWEFAGSCCPEPRSGETVMEVPRE